MIRHTVFGWRAITTWDANGSLIITPNFLLLSHGGVIQQRAFRYFSIQRETKKTGERYPCAEPLRTKPARTQQLAEHGRMLTVALSRSPCADSIMPPAKVRLLPHLHVPEQPAPVAQ